MRGYIVTSFDVIKVEAPVRIMLITGTGTRAQGEGDREMLDRVDLSVSGGVLSVKMRARLDNGFDSTDASGEAPLITLSTGQLRRVNVMGGAQVRVSRLDALEADLSLSGNGELTVDKASVERLALYVSGGGRLTIAGKAHYVRASVNGSGMLEAAGLDAHEATVSNDGPGSMALSVHGPVKVVSTGSGDTSIDGKPICSVTRRGTGAVKCGE